MAVPFEVETLDDVEEGYRGLYTKVKTEKGDRYRLDVAGLEHPKPENSISDLQKAALELVGDMDPKDLKHSLDLAKKHRQEDYIKKGDYEKAMQDALTDKDKDWGGRLKKIEVEKEGLLQELGNLRDFHQERRIEDSVSTTLMELGPNKSGINVRKNSKHHVISDFKRDYQVKDGKVVPREPKLNPDTNKPFTMAEWTAKYVRENPNLFESSSNKHLDLGSDLLSGSPSLNTNDPVKLGQQLKAEAGE